MRRTHLSSQLSLKGGIFWGTIPHDHINQREVKETGVHTYIHTQNLFYFPYMTHSPCSGNPPSYLEVTWIIIGAGWAGGRRLGGVPKLLPVLFPGLPPFPTQTPHFLIWQH